VNELARPGRPGPSEPAFRLTLHCTDGQARAFPLFADAAYDNVERALFWPDRPFSGEILDVLDDRSILLGASVRLYTHLIAKGEGTMHFTDDNGHEWGFAARSVVSVEISDPTATDRVIPPKIGFRPLEVTRPGDTPPPLRVIEGGKTAPPPPDGNGV